MDLPEVDIEAAHSAKDDSSSNGGGSSTKSYDPLPDGVLTYIVAFLDQNGRDAEIAVYDEDARELTDDEKEAFGLDASHQSAESLFGMTPNEDHIGGDPSPQPEECDDCTEDEACSEHSFDTDRHFPIDVAKRLNGHHTPDIWEAFGEEGHVRVGMGKASRHDRDERVRRRWLRMWYSTTEKQARSAKRDQLDAGTISEEEYVTWCLDNDLHPQSRKQDAPDTEWYEENLALF